MEISKTYAPSDIENKWYSQWMEKGFFHSEPDEREPFTIVIPPPNVTGVLHMGHTLNNTIQDLLIRRARMQGKNACWVPGTDHASIATEAKVVNMLKERGIDKNLITREEFLKYAWEWKEKYGGIILQQLKKLGASCDWDRVNFTMDPDYYQAVIKVFVDLYNKGLIYRGTQMVNWDPKAKTAVSDEEVNFKESNSKLYYIRYKIEGTESDFITIATTRPETILGDTAICVHPEDDRYKDLVGKHAFVPLINRAIPIIADEYVERDFGTGALKVTPAHDKNDYELGKKHKLETIDIFNADGTLNECAVLYVGKDRFAVRKEIAKELEEKLFLVKVEEIKSNVGYSERTDAVIEPRITQQWFCKMKEFAKPALDAVLENEVNLHPAKYVNTYRYWMENIRDWCVSRQLWWGQRIPAYYLPNGEVIVAESRDAALLEAITKTGNHNLKNEDLRQEEDVLDTWFSSWLWPIEVFKGITEPGNKDIDYYYPTNVLVTGPDIIFFWVARMIMAGYEYEKEKPFSDVYFTGIVRDKLGRKMSKQLGNSPDLLDLIEKSGADSVRFGVLISSPAGNDLLFDEKQIEQGRNFANKMWNALRLVRGWEEQDKIGENGSANDEQAIRWFENRLQQTLKDLEIYFKDFRISEALNTVYKLVWDDFCSWYLELVKPGRETQISRSTYEATIGFFESLMKLIHPFMPFISEEIWHLLRERKENDFCIVSSWPEMKNPDMEYLKETEKIFDLIIRIRSYRNEENMSPKEALDLYIKAENPAIYEQWKEKIQKLANINTFEFIPENLIGAKQFFIKSDEIYIPQTKEVDVEAEREKLTKELEYTRGFLVSVDAKLNNERFVQNAKAEMVEKERAKKADAEAKIKVLEESLARLA